MESIHDIQIDFCMEDHADDFINRAIRLSEFCMRHSLHGCHRLYFMRPNRMYALYDGIGPEWDFDVVSGIVGHMKEVFEPAAFIHDVIFKTSVDRSDSAFHSANWQFYLNCVKCAKIKYGWYNPKRYLAIRSAKKLYEACEEHGAKDWKKYSAIIGERKQLGDFLK